MGPAFYIISCLLVFHQNWEANQVNTGKIYKYYIDAMWQEDKEMKAIRFCMEQKRLFFLWEQKEIQSECFSWCGGSNNSLQIACYEVFLGPLAEAVTNCRLMARSVLSNGGTASNNHYKSMSIPSKRNEICCRSWPNHFCYCGVRPLDVITSALHRH